MRITELKKSLDSTIDGIYEVGFMQGYAVVLEEFEQLSDKLWNDGFQEAAESIRKKINELRGQD